MGIFSNIEKARASFDANYVRPGRYAVRIDRIKKGETRKKETFVAIEMTVFKTIEEENGRGHRPGENVTHLLMEKHDSFLPNIKSMIVNIAKCDPDEITEKHCESVVGDEQLFAGEFVEICARNQITKKNLTFTKVSYLRRLDEKEVKDLLNNESLTSNSED